MPMGMTASFLYESAKDQLRWFDVSVKKNIGYVMQIGQIYHMDDEAFSKIKSRSGRGSISLDGLYNLGVAMGDIKKEE